MTYTLTMFNTGQITLPKKRRSQWNTKHFTANEVDWGILIKPIMDEPKNEWVVYYENNGWFGIYCEEGIDPEKIIASLNALHNG